MRGRSKADSLKDRHNKNLKVDPKLEYHIIMEKREVEYKNL